MTCAWWCRPPPEYLRLVRLTAAGLASRLGFTFDEVEDLRIAVDELCFSAGEATTMPAGGPHHGARLLVGRRLHRDHRADRLTGASPEPNELSEQIL